MSGKSHSELANATADEITEVVNLMSSVLHGVPTSHVIISCLTVAIVLQKPDIAPGELTTAVMSTSKFIVAVLTAGEGVSDKREMN